MAARKTRKKAARGRDSRPRDNAVRREDRSFAEVLRTKSVERVVPEAVNRFEAGRQLYAKQAVASADAELALLLEERKRLDQEDGAGEPRARRIDRLISAVEADLAASRATLDAIDDAVAPQVSGWTAIGRVLRRDGAVPRGAEVLFVAGGEEPVDELGVHEPGKDGMVRVTYPAEVVKRLVQTRLEVAAAVRSGARIVATDETSVRLLPGRVYLFDLRVETAFDQ